MKTCSRSNIKMNNSFSLCKPYGHKCNCQVKEGVNYIHCQKQVRRSQCVMELNKIPEIKLFPPSDLANTNNKKMIS